MGFKITIKPTSQPVTLQEAKDHLRVDHDVEDALISELISMATDFVENNTYRPLITQTQTLLTDNLQGVIELKPNLNSVNSVKYIDTDGNQQTLPATDYEISTTDVIGTVFEAVNKTWPSVQCRKNAVEIEFICGYGVAADVPASIRSAMLLLIGHLYQNRESVTIGVSVTNTPMSVEMLLNPYRVISF